jgi:hypothetical protein
MAMNGKTCGTGFLLSCETADQIAALTAMLQMMVAIGAVGVVIGIMVGLFLNGTKVWT